MALAQSPGAIFRARLWAFLNYPTRFGLTWLELLTATIVGMLLVWVSLNDGRALAFAAPIAFYFFLLGYYRLLRLPARGLRVVYDSLFKPLRVPSASNKNSLAIILLAACVLIALAFAFVDARIGAIAALFFLASALVFGMIDRRERMSGARDLQTLAGRVPLFAIHDTGDLIDADRTRARIGIITTGISGFKPALAGVDVESAWTKFLAALAQDPQNIFPIQLFWLTDYHLGQLDLAASEHATPAYVRELRLLARAGARQARVILHGIVYPAELHERVRDYLAQMDFGLAPLGAFAAESLYRMIWRGESFLGQIQSAILSDGELPRRARRDFLPEQLQFGAQLQAEQFLNITRVITPFSHAREALMRVLGSVDGIVTLSITPLPRRNMATEIRGRLLAARVPGLGRRRDVVLYRDWLTKLEDHRRLEYLFETRTTLITWGRDERRARENLNLAQSYLPALNTQTLTERALEDSLRDWLPVLSIARAKDRAARFFDWLTAPPRLPAVRLLSSELVAALAREEGSDLHLADSRGRILLGRSVMPGKEGLRYADFRADTGPVLLVSDQGGGKTSTLIVWFILRLSLLKYKIIALNLKYSTRMQAAVEKVRGIVLHPDENLARFEQATRAALATNRAVLYQPIKGTRPYAIADDPCLLRFMQIFYLEWLPTRDTPAALVIDEIHRLMPKDQPLSPNAAETATIVAETFKDWAERKLVIAAATQTLRDLLGSHLGIALQKFRTAAYFQIGAEDRELLEEKGYSPELIDLIIGSRRRPRGYAALVMPDGFYTTVKVLVTAEEKELIQRLDVEETADVTPELVLH